MSHNCGCCKVLRVTCIQTSPLTITLTVTPTILRSKEKAVLCIGVPFASVLPGTNPVVVVDNGGVILPLLDCNGDVVRASSIGADRQWLVSYGNDLTPHLMVLRGVKDIRQCRCGDGYDSGLASTVATRARSITNVSNSDDDD